MPGQTQITSQHLRQTLGDQVVCPGQTQINHWPTPETDSWSPGSVPGQSQITSQHLRQTLGVQVVCLVNHKLITGQHLRQTLGVQVVCLVNHKSPVNT